jgi:hypothetical protein
VAPEENTNPLEFSKQGGAGIGRFPLLTFPAPCGMVEKRNEPEAAL